MSQFLYWRFVRKNCVSKLNLKKLILRNMYNLKQIFVFKIKFCYFLSSFIVLMVSYGFTESSKPGKWRQQKLEIKDNFLGGSVINTFPTVIKIKLAQIDFFTLKISALITTMKILAPTGGNSLKISWQLFDTKNIALGWLGNNFHYRLNLVMKMNGPPRLQLFLLEPALPTIYWFVQLQFVVGRS